MLPDWYTAKIHNHWTRVHGNPVGRSKVRLLSSWITKLRHMDRPQTINGHLWHDKCLHQLDNPRLTRMREKLTVYSFTVKWVEGKTNYIADALSRYPVINPDSSIDAEMAEPEQPEIVNCMRTTHAHGLQDICQYIDDEYNMIADVVESDQKWKKFSRHHPAMQFKGIMHRLSLHRTGCLLYTSDAADE